MFGLTGRLLVQDAEALSGLDDGAFDLVYAHGVLHHTHDPVPALRQIHRVLRPDGWILLMLYHRHILKYHVCILGYLRARVLLYEVTRALGRGPNDLEPHRERLLRRGVRSLRWDEFVWHCTDGPACPLARVYSRSEARALLPPWFDELKFKVAHFPLAKVLGTFPCALEGAIARCLSWYLFVYGRCRAS